MSGPESIKSNKGKEEKAVGSVAESADYHGNWSALLFSRLRTPAIRAQIIAMERMYDESMRGKMQKFVEVDQHDNVVEKEELFEPRSAADIDAQYDETLNEIETTTNIEYSDKMPNDQVIGLHWKHPTGETPTLRHKSLTEAHEKGHIMRQYDTFSCAA